MVWHGKRNKSSMLKQKDEEIELLLFEFAQVRSLTEQILSEVNFTPCGRSLFYKPYRFFFVTFVLDQVKVDILRYILGRYVFCKHFL